MLLPRSKESASARNHPDVKWLGLVERSSPMFESVEQLSRRLGSTGYFIDPVMTQVVFLAMKLRKPLLLEGPAGSGQDLYGFGHNPCAGGWAAQYHAGYVPIAYHAQVGA
jgi:hypothetical protein